jgi:hypothetical protein
MGWIRRRLSYANVVSTLALFLVLAGGAAFAARVPKKSVGPRQLKANAVTTAKIKANAVTTRKIRRNAVRTGKIRDGAIESAKIANGSVGLDDLDQGTLPFSRVAHRARGYSRLEISEALKAYPLSGSAYVQAADENDSFLGAMDVFFPPECKAPRSATAYLLLDSQKPAEFEEGDLVAVGLVSDESEGSAAHRIELGPFGVPSPTRFEPARDTVRKLSLVVDGKCTAGTGIVATFGGANVIGTK